MPFAAQCDFAAALGFDGLELAPFTLSDEPHRLPAEAREEMRQQAEQAGLQITSLHWLLLTPKGLSVTSPDAEVRRQTLEVLHGLVQLCADLGGSVLVHGSPAQRSVPEGATWDEAYARAREIFAAVASAAAAAGVTYCIEPLARNETNFINSLAEAGALIDDIGSPAFRTMIDTSAAGQAETESVPDLIRQWWPTGKIAHIQLNDTNRRAPGQGDDDFVAILAALDEVGYDRVAAVEPFVYEPDGPTTAARAIGFLRGIQEALA